jgi:hypothetical protein
MSRASLELCAAAILTSLLAGAVTWPQVTQMSGALIGHHDVYFSIWRLSWIAHALVSNPLHLFDANVFHPATGTLTYSDAILLQGLLASPFLWAGVSPTLVYNTLLLVGFAGSGLGVFVLARYLTSAAGPALVAAAAFTLAPYRIEHIMHLEMQWAMWIPLTLWALHRTIDGASWRWCAIAALFFWLQVISCVYYGVFLALLLAAVVPLLLLTGGPKAVRAVPALAVCAAIAAVLVLPYAWPYIQTSRALGGRDLRDVVRYSAHPSNYFATTFMNRVWGWTADRWGSNELRLFPGAIVIALSVASLLSRSRRRVLVYWAATALAVTLSFGVNTGLYRWLFDRLSLLQGLRSSARFAIVTSCTLAVLAALGAHAVAERTRRWYVVTVGALLVLMTAETLNRPFALSSDPLMQPSSVYKVVRSAPPGVVIELPLPRLSQLPGWDAYYSLWSIQHWKPLVNGYSGYYPPDYVQTMVRMERFPDEGSMARLRAHGVRYLVVHKAFFEPEQYTRLLLRMASQPELRPWGTYKDAFDDAALFVLER